MDITQRLREAKDLTRLLREFDGRGLDAIGAVAPGLLEALDAAEGNWLEATGAALTELDELTRRTAGRWLNPAHGAAVEAEIAERTKRHARASALLVDVSTMAADALAQLEEITTPDRAAHLASLRAGSVPERRITALYPFSLDEHLPAIIELALNSPQAPRIAKLVRNSDVLDAWDGFNTATALNAPNAMRAAYLRAEAALRTACGPRTAQSSQYENVVSMWAYLLVFFSEVASQRRAAVSARTKLASTMKRQCATVQALHSLLTRDAVAA